MARRNKKELAAARAMLNAPSDPETEYELAKRRLELSHEFLAEYKAGTHGFANRVEMTAAMIRLTQEDIKRFEVIISDYEAARKKPTCEAADGA